MVTERTKRELTIGFIAMTAGLIYHLSETGGITFVTIMILFAIERKTE